MAVLQAAYPRIEAEDANYGGGIVGFHGGKGGGFEHGAHGDGYGGADFALKAGIVEIRSDGYFSGEFCAAGNYMGGGREKGREKRRKGGIIKAHAGFYAEIFQVYIWKEIFRCPKGFEGQKKAAGFFRGFLFRGFCRLLCGLQS